MKKIFMLSAALPILAMAQVGINTTTPAATLDVQTKGNTETTKSLRIVNSDGKENVTVLDDGNVGIGTSNPEVKLHIVNGVVKVDNPEHQFSGLTPESLEFYRNPSSKLINDPSVMGYIDFKNDISKDFLVRIAASKLTSGIDTDTYIFFQDISLIPFNPFIFNTTKGNLGIGSQSPQTKLDIYSPTPATAIKIVDGSQGAGKVLTSDANGVGTWTNPASIMPTIMGNYGSGVDIPYTNDDSWYYTGSSITLPPKSKYIININFLIGLQSAPLDTNGYIFLRTNFCDSNINSTRSADVVDGVLISGTISSNATYGSVNGSCIVYNNSTSPKTYYLWAGEVISSPGTTKNIAKFGGNYWSERSFYATPIN